MAARGETPGPKPEEQEVNQEKKESEPRITLEETEKGEVWEIPTEVNDISEISLSPNGQKQLMVTKLEGGGTSVFVDFQKGPVYRTVEDVSWSANSDSIVYIAKKYPTEADDDLPENAETEKYLSKGSVVVFNGQEIDSGVSFRAAAVRSDGKKCAYVRVYDNGLQRPVVDGEERRGYPTVFDYDKTSYSSDNQKIAFEVGAPSNPRMNPNSSDNIFVKLGVYSDETRDHISNISFVLNNKTNAQFSPDGRHYFCVGLDSDTVRPAVYRDDELLVSGEQGYYADLSVAPDSNSFACVHYLVENEKNDLEFYIAMADNTDPKKVKEQHSARLVINGQERGESIHADISSPVWSPDSTKVAALVYDKISSEENQDKELTRVKVIEYKASDNSELDGKEYDHVSHQTYSLDGKHLAYFASDLEGDFFLVVDNEELHLYDEDRIKASQDPESQNRPIDLRFEAKKNDKGEEVTELKVTMMIDREVITRVFNIIGMSESLVRKWQQEGEEGLFEYEG
ncbi:hypothetical protein KKC60_05005 [Patescibacteria group bacterium]|nr:hypothetical protein [Patescibacteria group bacterium]